MPDTRIPPLPPPNPDLIGNSGLEGDGRWMLVLLAALAVILIGLVVVGAILDCIVR